MEKKSDLISRLLAEANAGISSKVSLIDALEFRRQMYGLSMSQFAQVLGMQPSHYSEFLSGDRGLSLRVLKRAHAIGVPAKVLLQREFLKTNHDTK